MIEVQCPDCDTVLQIPERYAGTKGRCNHCRGLIYVPPIPEAPESVKPLVMAAIDIETTGFKAGRHEIIEVAGVLFDPYTGEIFDTFSELVRPENSIPARITKVTGITNEDVRAARSADQVIGEFVIWLDQAMCLVAHNAPFDASFLAAALDEHGIEDSAPIIIDTLTWARDRNLPTPDHKLETLLDYIEAPVESLHRADADAHGVMYLMRHLVSTSTESDQDWADLYTLRVRDHTPEVNRRQKRRSSIQLSATIPSTEETADRWRMEPASLKQARFLESLGMDITAIPHDMTKGQASDMITHLTDKRIETTIVDEVESSQKSTAPALPALGIQRLLLALLVVGVLVIAIMSTILYQITKPEKPATPAPAVVLAPEPEPEPKPLVKATVPAEPSTALTELVYTSEKMYHRNKACPQLGHAEVTAALEETAIRLRMKACPICVKQ